MQALTASKYLSSMYLSLGYTLCLTVGIDILWGYVKSRNGVILWGYVK